MDEETPCRPCPFCGETDIEPDGAMTMAGFSAACPTCGALGPDAHSEEDSVMRWNARVGDDQARLQALETQLANAKHAIEGYSAENERLRKMVEHQPIPMNPTSQQT